MSVKLRKHPLLLSFMIIAAMSIIAFASSLVAQTNAASPKPWPAFEMVYTDWGAKRGHNDSPGYSKIRLTYYNPRNWRSEVLEDSVNPAAAGSYAEFNGDQLTGFNAQFNKTETTQLSPTEGLYAPADWLFPGRVESLQSRHGGIFRDTETAGLLSYSFVEQVPCDSTVSRCQSASSQVTTEFKLNKETKIPIELVVQSDGALSRHITVGSFRLLP